MAFRKACFMTDTSMMPETPNVAETAHSLRRFADMMSIGYNANFLHHAAVWLETLGARLAAARMKNNSGATSTKPSPSIPTRWKPNARRSSMTSMGTWMSPPDDGRTRCAEGDAAGAGSRTIGASGDPERERDELAAKRRRMNRRWSELRAAFERDARLRRVRQDAR